jgi:hypothetical protein
LERLTAKELGEIQNQVSDLPYIISQFEKVKSGLNVGVISVREPDALCGLPGFFYCGIFPSAPCPIVEFFRVIRSPLLSVDELGCSLDARR